MRIHLLPIVEPGTYHGRFLGAKQAYHDEFGAGIRWDWKIDQGEYAGATVSRTTQDVASAKNACGQFLELVSGLTLDSAVMYDTDEWIGQTGAVVVEASPTGEGVRVASFTSDGGRSDVDGGSPSF